MANEDPYTYREFKGMGAPTKLAVALAGGTGVGYIRNALLLQHSVNTVAASGATQTIPDTNVSTINVITLSANCTLTFPTAVAGKELRISLVQDATGSRLVTWPGTAKWAGGTAPTLSTAAGKVDYITAVCVDGTNWYCVARLDMR